MAIASIPSKTGTISSTKPTAAQRELIAGTSLQVGDADVQGFFRSLQGDDKLRIIGATTANYNCISWSHGVTDAWNNPPADPMQYYKDRGYKLCTSGDADKKIAVWFDNGVATHAAVRKSVSIDGSNTWCWTSKLGQSYCISHSIDKLNEGGYGVPGMYFK